MYVYLNQPETKTLFNVPQDIVFVTDPQVSEKLDDDIMQSQASKMELLLENVRVLLYQVIYYTSIC